MSDSISEPCRLLYTNLKEALETIKMQCGLLNKTWSSACNFQLVSYIDTISLTGRQDLKDISDMAVAFDIIIWNSYLRGVVYIRQVETLKQNDS